MKTSIYKNLIPMLLGVVTSAFASVNNSGIGGDGMMVWLFISFGVMALLIQAVPAIVTFFSMLKGLIFGTHSDVFFCAEEQQSK